MNSCRRVKRINISRSAGVKGRIQIAIASQASDTVTRHITDPRKRPSNDEFAVGLNQNRLNIIVQHEVRTKS